MPSLSIRQKLIGLVVVLLAGMMGVAGYSFSRTSSLRDDVADLSEELLPLINSLTLVNTHARDQQVVLERTLRYLRSPDKTDEDCQKSIEEFERLHAEIHDQIAEARGRAQSSSEKARTPDDIRELAMVYEALVVLAEQHETFSKSADELLKDELASRGSARTEKQELMFAFKEERLVEEVDALDHHLEEQLEHLEAFTTGRAHDLEQAELEFYRTSRFNLALAAVASFLGLIIAVVITYRVVRPLNDLVMASHRVQDGDLGTVVEVLSTDEVGELAAAFNTMVEGLRAREQVKEAFGKYLDPRIVENVLVGNTKQLGESEADRQVMTVFFSDMAGFSAISEQLTPTGLVKIINRYFTLATEPIAASNGVVDKYIGDAIMAFWGPPFTDKFTHATLACQAALEQADALAEFRRQLPELLGFRKGLPKVDVRIGLCTGDLVVGNIGSERAKSFTVMGDTVNIASRLEGANKQYGTGILMSEMTYEQVKDDYETREIDTITVVGKKEPTRIFELLAHKGKLEPTAAQLRDTFEEALAAYRKMDWNAAEELLKQCQDLDPEDGPTKALLDRVRALRVDPPDDGWDGVWRLSSK